MKRIITLLVLALAIIGCKQDSKTSEISEINTKLSGPVFGTSFSVIYNSETNFMTQFDSLFAVVNKSMSTYIPDSDISKINRNESDEIDEHFKKVMFRSQDIYARTRGAFDPTIGAVVNAWSFGPEGEIVGLDSLKIKELMSGVGLNKVTLVVDSEGSKIEKPDNTYIDFNAIAKGYGVDVIADYLETQNIENYLVEIGGEIRAKGINIEKKAPWRVGLDEPRFDGGQSVYKAITLADVGMATSGTYRKFKVDELGKRYTHIINTETGYPSKSNILSVSVIAEDCMTADAYATAFQAMGIESVKEFLNSNPELKVFIIFANDNNELETDRKSVV